MQRALLAEARDRRRCRAGDGELRPALARPPPHRRGAAPLHAPRREHVGSGTICAEVRAVSLFPPSLSPLVSLRPQPVPEEEHLARGRRRSVV